MTPDEVQAHFERIEATQRETAERFERLATVCDARTAELLASAVPTAPAPPPPPQPPPGKPSGGLPTFGAARPTPAAQLGNGVPVPGQAVAQAAARQAELRARREQYQREQAERAWRNSQPPKSPPVRSGRR